MKPTTTKPAQAKPTQRNARQGKARQFHFSAIGGDVKIRKEGKGLAEGMIGFSPKRFETTNSLRLRIKWRNCIVEMTKQGKVG